jgi:periplasmic protein TonB
MDINKILSADILDIIFDGRNKQYGAYDLRKRYNKTISKALLITAGVALIVFLSSFFISKLTKNVSELDVVDTQLAEIKKDAPPPPPKAPPPPEINQVKFTPPKIVKDEEVKEDEKIEEIKEDQVISTKTVESDNKEAKVEVAPEETKGTQVVEVKKEDDENKIWTKVEKEAEYPGGDAAWRNFLQNNLRGEVPVDNGAGPGTYQVIVKFIVSKDGSLSDVQCESDPGHGMCAEAMRVIKKTKSWKPANQNGREVNAYRRQPITFQVNEE